MEQEQISNAGAVTRNVSSLRMPLARGLMALSVEVPWRRTWNVLPGVVDTNASMGAYVAASTAYTIQQGSRVASISSMLVLPALEVDYP